MDEQRRIDKIFVLHIWACIPFVPAWIFGIRAAPADTPVAAARAAATVAAAYLVARTWIVFRGRDPVRFAFLWPVVDVALVTSALVGLNDAEDPTSYLYILAVAYATLKLPARGALGIVVLAVGGQLLAGLVTRQWTDTRQAYWLVERATMAVVFRHYFIALMASLILFLRRENERVAERLAVTEYQRDLSAEMHDGIQHDLVLMARRLELADAVRPHDPERAANLASEQRDTARRVADELRAMVREIRPGQDGADTPPDLLERHLASVSERSGVPVSLDREAPIPAAYRRHVLRIVQESLTNALKHAAPGRIAVRWRKGGLRYRLTIRDDGAGFSPETAAAGSGLSTMRERAAQLGGDVRVTSAPGQGTRVLVRLPLVPSERTSWLHGPHPRSSD